MQNERRNAVFKNRLFLTSLLNAGIFLVYVFSMCYYDWVSITVAIYSEVPGKGYVERGTFDCFANLVYVKQTDRAYYQTYGAVSQEVCINNDIYCQAAFEQMQIVGVVSFIMLAIGGVFQVFDIGKMIHYFVRQEKEVDYREEKQDNLRYILTIGHFLIGLTLDIFGMSVSEVSIRPGVSFWLFVASLLCFILVIIYEQISLSQMRKQTLILKLIQAERKISNQQGDTELTSHNDSYL